MKKNFLAAAIIGFATLGTANASEMNQDLNQDLNFMTDHEMHNVTGAQLEAGFSFREAMLIVNRRADRLGLNIRQRARLGIFAQKLINSRTTYDKRTFVRMIAIEATLSKKRK